jgi:EAL domain-containing protein (putative c-di-GMP-specific phosphodiesterase class I)/GGDEF domain-containing protein
LFGYTVIPSHPDAGKDWDFTVLFQNWPGNVKLFLPVPARFVPDSGLHPGRTLDRIEAAGMRAEQIVFMFAEDGSVSTGNLTAAIRHYRTQGFRIGYDGLTAGRESLEQLTELKPDYVRVGKAWLPRGAKDHVGECLLQALAALAKKEKFVLLADGVEKEEQIRTLMSCGVGYGQGLWIGAPSKTPAAVGEEVSNRIRQEMRRRYRGSSGSLMELANPAVTFPSTTPVSEIARFFEVHREADGFVIVEGKKPVGMLMKDKLHQILSRQFGLPLYGNRPVSKIMDAQPLIVDESTPVDLLSQTAMAREPDRLYDAIIVTRGGEVAGIISISALLDWVTNVRMSNAQWANPLTGLPGNEPIRRELSRRLDEGRPFSVLYADLDYFKWYNDQYGFHRGDDVIRYTSEAIQAAIRACGTEDNFVGHIGGDDFIVVIDYGNPVRIGEQILQEFEKGISSFLEPSRGPVKDRSGKPVEDGRLSLSLALLTCQDSRGWTPERLAEYSALLKKTAKSKAGNALEWETLGPYPKLRRPEG